MICLADFISFVGWFSIWKQFLPFGRSFLLAYLPFSVGFYRLWEGLLLCQDVPVPAWARALDIGIRAVMPLMFSFYLHRVYYHATYNRIPA